MAQIICRYHKRDEVRWISHLDLKRTLERAMRRAQLPLALSQGHNPHPKISLSPPLPLGATGDAELFSVQLAEGMDPGELKQRINDSLPSGLEVMEAWVLPAHRKKETFGDIDIAQYSVTVKGEVDAARVSEHIADLMGQEELIVQRGGKRPPRSLDIRPFILSLALAQASEDGVELRMRLRTGSHGGARPQEVIELLALNGADRTITYHRTGLFAGAQLGAERASAGRSTGAPRAGRLHRWTRSRSSRERSESP